MQEHSSNWTAFIEKATDLASSLPAKERISSIADLNHKTHWAKSSQEANELQKETQDAMIFESASFFNLLIDAPSPSEILKKLKKQGVPGHEELWQFRSWVNAMVGVLETFKETEEIYLDHPFFQWVQAHQSEHSFLERIFQDFEKTFTSEGEISSNASKKLSLILKQSESLKQSIMNKLEQLASRYYEKGLTQSITTDCHDGRYVISVKASSRAHVPGNVHGVSSTRKTVFIEPTEIGNLNQSYQELEIQKNEEIHRILKALSQSLQARVDLIKPFCNELIRWDAARARALMSLKTQGIPLQINDSGHFELRSFFHPLLCESLSMNQIVSNSLELDPKKRVLLVSGPNTGGKTVFCEAVLFAARLSRTGFFLSSHESAPQVHQIPFFQSILVDQGDPQSIEENLSSFSGRILKFRKILDYSNDGSLVFLDELNSATDPKEGAALCQAFLEALSEKGAWILATTHDPHLKTMATTHPSFLNAGMVFDHKTHLPTFQIHYGISGTSEAIETAKRLGMPSKIIARAEVYLKQNQSESEKILKLLETKQAELDRFQKELERKNQALIQKEEEFQEKAQKRLADSLENAEKKIREIIDQARLEVETKKRNLSHAQRKATATQPGVHSGTSTHLDRTLSVALRKLESFESPLGNSKARKTPSQFHSENEETELKVGMIVELPRLKQRGKILRIQKNKISIQLEGGLGGQVEAKPSDIKRSNLSKPTKARLKSSKKSHIQIYSQSSSETKEVMKLDLRGKRYEEAMAILDRFLDQSFTQGVPVVQIIHGIGTGALRKGTLELVSQSPMVRSYEDGGADLGGAGCTWVYFEKAK